MNNYDPMKAPDPTKWLNLDEQERISLVEDYHRAAKTKLPNVTIHAAFHVTVENQIAEAVPSTLKAMARLANDGLSRHDAVHAVAAVVAEHVATLMKGQAKAAGSSQAALDAKLEKLTAKEWKRKYGA